MLKKGWFGGGMWKPKNPHSLEHLRYLYTVLSKNQVVQDSNRSLLVETLRSISEILIWGDQNDSSVFDFFLEKGMLSFFLKIMKQRCGSYVCVQLLQTLNILFENIRNETSLYYLLSNNHVNSIIIHKFDFSDEEVMAYYISFLKTLSFKLNTHTIHFFYNEHTNDFPLYTEAIKFFNHSETMVRIAVRTLTLNVYRVEDQSMLNFIRDRTAAPYFSNLVWFIGNHILELDSCVRSDVDHNSKIRLTDLVAEHLDHLHYLNDIFRLNITELNYVLSDHLLNRLLVPLLVYSLNHQSCLDDRPRVSRVVSLFLLSQVFLIFSFSPLMRILAQIILHGDNSLLVGEVSQNQGPIKLRPEFGPPQESLEKSLRNSCSELSSPSSSRDDFEIEESRSYPGSRKRDKIGQIGLRGSVSSISLTKDCDLEDSQNSVEGGLREGSDPGRRASNCLSMSSVEETHLNITDEQKERIIFGEMSGFAMFNSSKLKESSLSSRPFLKSVLDSLNCSENDYVALFSLWLLYALGHNTGLNKNLLTFSLGQSMDHVTSPQYSGHLVDLLLRIVTQSAQHNSKIRVVTLELSLEVLGHQVSLAQEAPAVGDSTTSGKGLIDQHLAALAGAMEEATLILRNFYKGEEIFLDTFEDEWRALQNRPLKVEDLLRDSSVLLPPTGTPLTGIDLDKRLPCGEVERARRAMRVFFLVRAFCLGVKGSNDPHLPLTNPAACIQVSDVLDLNNSDLIACVVIPREGPRTRRFLVIDVIQLVLVEPDQRKMGWGVAKFVGFLQDLEVSGDKDDSRMLHVTIHRPSASSSSVIHGRPSTPLLAAKFVFDDHIRCMAAKQRLTKGRMKTRQKKLHQIARLLELPQHLQPCPSPPANALTTMRHEAQRRSSNRNVNDIRGRSSFQKQRFNSQSRGPGMAFKSDVEGVASSSSTSVQVEAKDDQSTARDHRSSSARPSRSSSKSRRGIPNEEIQMENLSRPPNSTPMNTNEDTPKKDLRVSRKLVTSTSLTTKRIRSRSTNSRSIDLPSTSIFLCSVPGQLPFQRGERKSEHLYDDWCSSYTSTSKFNTSGSNGDKLMRNHCRSSILECTPGEHGSSKDVQQKSSDKRLNTSDGDGDQTMRNHSRSSILECTLGEHGSSKDVQQKSLSDKKFDDHQHCDIKNSVETVKELDYSTTSKVTGNCDLGEVSEDNLVQNTAPKNVPSSDYTEETSFSSKSNT